MPGNSAQFHVYVTPGLEPARVAIGSVLKTRHALRPGEERSRVQELLSSPPPGTLDVRPAVTAGRPAAEGGSSHLAAGEDPRGEIVTISPPPVAPDAPEPPP